MRWDAAVKQRVVSVRPSPAREGVRPTPGTVGPRSDVVPRDSDLRWDSSVSAAPIPIAIGPAGGIISGKSSEIPKEGMRGLVRRSDLGARHRALEETKT